MLLAQSEQLVDGGVQFAKEFGLEGFLLTAILFALAFGLWKIGGRVADALIVAVSNIADSGRKTSEATLGIKNAMDIMANNNISMQTSLDNVANQNITITSQTNKIANTQLAIISILMQHPNISDAVKQNLNTLYEDVRKQTDIHAMYK